MTDGPKRFPPGPFKSAKWFLVVYKEVVIVTRVKTGSRDGVVGPKKGAEEFGDFGQNQVGRVGKTRIST